MEIALHIDDVGPELRWNWLQFFEQQFLPLHARIGLGEVLGTFISFRDDARLVWMMGFRDRAERLAFDQHAEMQAMLASTPMPVRESLVRVLTPAIGTTIPSLDDLRRMSDPVLELRRYRIAAGMRARFATFLRDRTLDEQTRRGMTIYGPFDDVDDANHLVWFRGFPDLAERDRRKASFYQSKLWVEELQEEAFSMIEDYSNVLLLTRTS